MKKNINIFILVILSLLVLVGCKKPVKLSSPEIKLNETILSWSAIENAKSYKVVVNDKEFETETTSYDLKTLEESKFEIHVIAIGDGKDYLDSDPSNQIKITPINQIEIVKGDTSGGKTSYKLITQSNANVYGISLIILFDNTKLSIEETSVKWTSLLPSTWIYDIYVVENEVRIALTGLTPINVRLAQNLANLEFTGETGNVSIKSYTIDNN